MTGDELRSYRVGMSYRNLGSVSQSADEFLRWLNQPGSGMRNMGGIRPLRFLHLAVGVPAAVILVTDPASSGSELNPWQDDIASADDRLAYWGDAKWDPVRRIDDFVGNRALVAAAHANQGERTDLRAPFLHFVKQPGREVRFTGLWALERLEESEFLDQGRPVRNYLATFTKVDVEAVEVEWIRRRVRATSSISLVGDGPTEWSGHQAALRTPAATFRTVGHAGRTASRRMAAAAPVVNRSEPVFGVGLGRASIGSTHDASPVAATNRPMSRGEANAVLRGQISWNEYAQTSLARKDLPKRIRSVSGSEASDLGVAELTAGALAQLVFVSDWRVTDHDSPSADRRGYQRPLAATRLSPIARYIAESDGRHLFPPIILSVRHVHARQRDEFLDLLRTGNIAGIHNRWGSNTVCAVDGQHRMGGALHAAMSDHPDLDRVYYSTMFYFDLDYVTEAKWFATINSTSKPVPRSLVEWTKVDITEAESVTPEQQIRRIAQRLADEGPWKDSVNFGGGYAAGRHITFEGLRRATHDMFGGVVPGTSHLPRFADPYMFACHFWEAVAEMWPEAWNAKPDAPEKYRLRELVGLAALAKACAWMIRHGINQGFVGPRLEDYVLERLGRLQSFRWLKTIDPRHSDVYDIGSGFAGQGPLAERLYQRSEARG